MPYAIIRSGGKQYRVSEGDRVRVEKLPAEIGDQVALDNILAVGQGGDLKLGAAGDSAVQARVVRHGLGRKIRIWKYRRRKGYEHRQGHRQMFTEVQILSIPGGNAAAQPAGGESHGA